MKLTTQVSSVSVDAEYIASLPKVNRKGNVPFVRTQAAPCPLVQRCNSCNQYLPVVDYYSISTRTSGRLDALGKIRAYKCPKCSVKQYLDLSVVEKLYYGAKNRAKVKGIPFTITRQDIVVPEFCPILGIRLTAAVGAGVKPIRQLPNSPTLDRIVNHLGYVPGNIAVISCRANLLKHDGTLEELRAIVKYMENHASSSTSATEVTS